MTASLRTALLAGAALLPCVAAQAADVTPEQGAAAETAVRDWVGGMLGPSVKMPDRPVRLTPAGDHFDVSVPITTLPGATAGAAGSQPVTLTMQARPLDGGKWALDGIRTAMPLHFTVNVPVPPAKEGANAGKAPRATVPVAYTVDIKDQDGHGIIDPGFATPSTWTNTATGANIHTEGGPFPSDTQVGAYNGVVTVQPAGADLADLSTNATINDYHMSTPANADMPFTLDMKTLRVAMNVTGLNRSHAQTLTQNAATLLTSLSGPGSASPKVSREVAAAMLDALKNAASAVSVDEVAEGIAVNAGGIPVAVGKAELGLGGKSVDGILEAHMPIDVQGLSTSGALPPDMAALVPTVVSFHPVVSGVGVAELSRIAAALNEDRDPAPADIQALFSHGGVKLGLDSMTLALAGATFEGMGTLVYASPEDGTGSAQITATGYDEMMQKVAAIPAFSGQAVPVLAFVKGIGRTVDGKLVWNIAYKNNKLLVNDVDMTSLAGAGGGGAPKAAPAPDPAPAPAPAAPRRPAHPPARPQNR